MTLMNTRMEALPASRFSSALAPSNSGGSPKAALAKLSSPIECATTESSSCSPSPSVSPEPTEQPRSGGVENEGGPACPPTAASLGARRPVRCLAVSLQSYCCGEWWPARRHSKTAPGPTRSGRSRWMNNMCSTRRHTTTPRGIIARIVHGVGKAKDKNKHFISEGIKMIRGG